MGLGPCRLSHVILRAHASICLHVAKSATQLTIEEKTFCSQLRLCFYHSFSLDYTQLEEMLTCLRSLASSVPPTASYPTASTPSAPLESTPTSPILSASVLTQLPLPSLPPSMMTEVSGPPPLRRRQHHLISQSHVMPSSIPSVLPPPCHLHLCRQGQCSPRPLQLHR